MTLLKRQIGKGVSQEEECLSETDSIQQSEKIKLDDTELSLGIDKNLELTEEIRNQYDELTLDIEESHIEEIKEENILSDAEPEKEKTESPEEEAEELIVNEEIEKSAKADEQELPIQVQNSEEQKSNIEEVIVGNDEEDNDEGDNVFYSSELILERIKDSNIKELKIKKAMVIGMIFIAVALFSLSAYEVRKFLMAASENVTNSKRYLIESDIEQSVSTLPDEGSNKEIIEEKNSDLSGMLDKGQKSVESEKEETSSLQEKKIIVEASSPIKIKKRVGKKEIQDQLLQAYTAFTKKNYQQAGIYYQKVLGQDEENVDALNGLAMVYIKNNKMTEAKNYFYKVLDIDATNHFAKVTLIKMAGDLPVVEQEILYKELLEEEPKSLIVREAAANFYVSQSRWKKAQENYFVIMTLAPGKAKHIYNLAVSLDKLGKAPEALTYYIKARESYLKENDSERVDTIQQRIIALQDLEEYKNE